MSRPMRILMIDNRDSFVFNLVDELRRTGSEVVVVRSGLSLEDLERHIARLNPELVVLSPGPGTPEASGVMVPWLRTMPKRPVLGICLGHQAMGVAFGGEVGRAPEPVHGRASVIELEDDPIFEALPRSIAVARYHSLVVTKVPSQMKVTATLNTRSDGTLVMAMRHVELPYVGLQFHPESILTPLGTLIVRRIALEAKAWHRSMS